MMLYIMSVFNYVCAVWLVLKETISLQVLRTVGEDHRPKYASSTIFVLT